MTSSDVPASVMATKRLPDSSVPTALSTRPRKYLYSTFGSIVLPDFEETMNRVVDRSTASLVAFTAAGIVESNTRRAGAPSIGPKQRFSVSVPKLLPPMPNSTTC